MKCEHCGKPLTNLDRLKACRHIEDIDDLIEKLCSETICPLKKWCGGDNCLMNTVAEWLLKEAE